ncbi:MAG TPA: hypothetical protein VIB82_09025 [Caulobacteraceae bacterium]|jgi:hypothetical protein
MDNPLDDALGHAPEAPETHVEAPAEAEPQATPEGPAKGPDGKIAAKVEAPAEPAPPEPGQVPISAMLDEREKRQGLEKQLAAFKAREAEARRAAAEPPPPDEQFTAALHAQNLRVSRRFAEREYGPELMATVHDWAVARCDADPFFNAQMRSSDDPYGAAFQAYNREQIAAKVTPERLAAFEAWEAAQAAIQAQTPTPPPQSVAAPPRSLANAPGNALGTRDTPPRDEGDIFADTLR